MKQIILLVFAALMLSFGSSMQAGKDKPELLALLIPDNLKKNANAVVRYSDFTFEVLSEGRTTLTAKVAITILNRNGEEFEHLVLGYDKYKTVEEIKGSVYDSFGNFIRDNTNKEIDDYCSFSGYSMFSDNRIKHLHLTYNKYPYTIEFNYRILWKGLIYYPEWDIQSKEKLSIQSSRYTVIAPAGHKFKYCNENIEIEPTIKSIKNKIQYTWKASNLPAIESESYSPPLQAIIPVVYFSPDAFKIENHKGSAESWTSLGKFTYDLNAGRDLSDPNHVAEIKKLIRYDKTRIDKINTLYHYLQETTRYVSIQIGLGGWQCFDADVVHQNKYGDCKALSNYMKAMLKVAGIESYITKIRAGNKINDLILNFPSNQFNHWILCIPGEKDTTWLECTSQNKPTGYMGRFTSNRHAVLVTPQGGVLVTTPKVYPEDNLQIRKGVVQLELQGSSSFQVSTHFTGYQYSHPSFLMHQNDEDETKKWLQRKLDIPSGTLSEITFSQLNNKLPEVYLNYNVAIRNLAACSKSRFFLTPNFYEKTNKLAATRRERKYPVFNNYPYLDIDTITFILPTGYIVEGIKEYPLVIESDFGNYYAHCIFSAKQDTLTYVRKLKLESFNLPADTYSQLESFFNEISKADKSQIVFRREE